MNEYQPAGGMANSKVSLDLRGRRISIERESLMELPESVLLCLFPNGVVLSPQRLQGQVEDDQQEDVYFVDVSPPTWTVSYNLMREGARPGAGRGSSCPPKMPSCFERVLIVDCLLV